MKRILSFCFLFMILFYMGCSEREVVAPTEPETPEVAEPAPDAEALAMEILAQAGWPVDPESGLPETVGRCTDDVFFQRTVVVDDIAHYFFRIRVGWGEHDFVGLHRVVRERFPFRPIRTPEAAFLLHGDIKDFTGMFLPGVSSPGTPDDFGLAVTLAQADMDVWGLDQGWTLVPAGVTDFGFMADWGLDRNVRDLGLGIRIARLTRLFSGNGLHQVNLLGYSSGCVTGCALLNAESQLPPCLRQVAGFVGGDYAMLSDDPGWIEVNWGDYEYFMDLWDQGVYQFDSPFPIFGIPAAEDPDGPSALIEGLTNLQAAIGVGAWQSYPNLGYHFVDGVFDADGIPVGLEYTDVGMWIDFMVTGPPYEAAAFQIDYIRCVIMPEQVPWDDHLGDVTVPVLYVKANGGAGAYGDYTFDVMGSTDVTRLEIGFLPPEEAANDFAHVDLFIANDAPTLVFAPIRDWLLDHTP